jgi:hypothetical protein
MSGGAFCLADSDRTKAEQNRSFYLSSSCVVEHDKTIRLGLAMPAVGVKENMSLSFSGVLHVFTGGEHQTNSDILRITPFVAQEGTSWSSSTDSIYSLGNIHYLPSDNTSFDTCNINTNVILKDCGYGFDIRTLGTFVGFEISNARSTNVTINLIKGSINVRYNYAPIKTLDLEV